MSLILDALRKSDHQRTRHATERLHDGPSVARVSRFPTPVLFLLIVIALSATAVAVTLLLTIDRGATAGATKIAENARATEAAPVRALGMEVTSRPIDATRPEPLPSPATSNAVAAPARTLTIDELTAPPLASLPATMRGKIPPLHVNIHAWAEDPDSRFVLINLKRYGEGDRLAEGPQVRHILRDGVVLEFEGILFSLPRR